MISSDKAKEFLQSKEIKNLAEQRLKAVQNKLRGDEQRLGMLLINEAEEYKQNEDEYSEDKVKKRRTEIRLHFFDETEEICMWETKFKRVLPVLFGDFAPYIIAAWKNINTLMYQTGYARRSFRAPDSPALFGGRKVDWLDSLLDEFKYDLSLPEYAQYIGYISSYWHLSTTHVFAAAIQADDTIGRAVKKVIIDTIYGKDKIGKISRSIIKSLLLTDVHENHVVIEKLLLSAQRQEGLRQSILESLDETTLSAQKHMMQVVLDNDLLRFSSVVRALDVWCGMEWESAKISTLKRCLQLGFDFLTNPKTIDPALESMDNLEIYMALWASACLDIKNTIPRIETVLKRKEAEKQATALFFLSHIGRPDTQTELALPFLESENLLLTAFAFPNVVSTEEEDKAKHLKILLDLWKRIEDKKYTVEGKVFNWTHHQLLREDVMRKALSFSEIGDFALLEPYFEKMEVYSRRDMAQRFLNPENELSQERRAFIFVVLADRAEWVRDIAFLVLKDIKLLPGEAINAENLLKRKGAELRKGVLNLLFRQEEKEVFESTERLLNSGKIQERLGGLDLLNQLYQKKMNPAQVQQLAEAYKQRKKLSDKELIILSNLNPDNEEYSEENGFGIYDPKKMTLSPPPIDRLNCGDISDAKEGDSRHPYDFDLARLAAILEEMLQLFEVNKNHEYEIEEWDKTMTKKLLGNSSINRRHQYSQTEKDLSPRDILEDFPLHEAWEKWYKESDFTPKELWLFGIFARPSWGYSYGRKPDFLKTLKAFFKPYIPHKIYKTDSFQGLWSAINIVDALSGVYPFEGENDFCLETAESILSFIPKENLAIQSDENHHNSWRGNDPIDFWMRKIKHSLKGMNKAQLSKAWNLSNWFFRSAKAKRIRNSTDWRPSINLNVAAYKQGLINEDDFTESILFGLNDFRSLTTKDKKQQSEYQKDEEVMHIVSKCVNRVLDIELKRGDTETLLTPQVTKFQSIYGIDRLIGILSALKKDNLQKGYVYSWGGQSSKKESFSHLLRVCYPKKEETLADFSAAVKKAKISEQRILEVAMYSPQWLPMIQEFFGWKKLTDAVWWFHAHTKESGYEADDRWTSDVNTYTSLTPSELSDGAVDVQWFKEVYKGLKKARWEKLYTAAKYISTGPGYRRAQIFADAMLGNFKIKALTDEIVDKRNQDKVRAFGLVPLNKRNPEADILKRYKILQRFLKESKQFGSQRQVSEKAAVKVSMENLARTAAYPDPIRLSWAMEALEAKEILEKSKPFVENGVEIVLQIDEAGMTHLNVTKEGKILKAIPAKLRKNKTVLQLKEYRKTLKEQYRRTRKALEEAMCRGDEFKVSEIDSLLQHPVVAPQLKNLILSYSDADKTTVGYYEKGNLVVPEKNTFTLPDEAFIRLAHCTDLHKSGNWSDLQSDCFRNKRIQPFKQIFRELYLPTHDELTEVTTSRRYAGHQVQPKKTVALLKTRGWTVDPDTGLRKVYHKENLIVNLFALADWFTPGDVEAPTLETVSFTDRDSHKLVPFKELSPLIFSEVMRDIDLVVSVAHAGGVDPEASHSTIEMRTVMAEETAMLLNLKNVKLKGNHITIKGKLADYSVHLGSGVVHKMPGGYLSILPVHSAHRGRIFLPFADDDPKTSEILSKMLLLAEDDKIQDPTVLRQL